MVLALLVGLAPTKRPVAGMWFLRFLALTWGGVNGHDGRAVRKTLAAYQKRMADALEWWAALGQSSLI